MHEKNQFKPFISADKVLPEMTLTSVSIGIILAIVFGAANAYLGLKVGMTISASIPAAVMSMGIIRVILKRDSILENNLVQTIGSAGESIAAGAIFTLPAIFIWMEEWGQPAPSLIEISIICLCGGILGVLFMIPLRKALIVKEHGVLPYPEGTACSEVLLAGEEGGSKASGVFAGLGIAAAYKFLSEGFKIFPSEVHYEIQSYKGSAAGIDVLPALLGVGYICGIKISSYMFAGGILGWFAILPLISLFAGNTVMYPGTDPISSMGSFALWSNYLKYIGAGAVAAGGIMSLIKSLPLIVSTFSSSIKDLKSKDKVVSQERTDKDLPVNVIIIGIVALIVIIWLIPTIPVSLGGAILITIFGFFFATVSSRIVGLVGSSNNPVSGMTIATLLITTMILKLTGVTGREGMLSAIAIGSVICIIAAIAGDTSQDLKTGYIVGATPYKQQIGEIIGVVASSITIGGALYLLNAAWGFGSDKLAAPQATLMKMVVEGVMNGNLPWNLVFTGVAIAIFIAILGIPVLPFAIGLYLPIHLSTGIMVGGLVRMYFEKKKNISETKRKDAIDRGVLYTSGLIAGEGLIGILLAVFAILKVGNRSLAEIIDMSGIINLGSIGALIFFALLIVSLFKFTIWNKGASK
ncbi:oligopeptide transporter, OPT family [Clostridium sp. cel8]|uniref:OPT family oligopeptide transporter n=1 Tax=Clostridium sp. cel8 TaxID=2663123 RepID=UPI0015F7428A|nr:oligopeptide transporter, OPT family [Clostridium sp. cel8]MBA5851640.1 oligopeptide transporter, OPT family [Clostridium sp. cel8]